MLNTQLLRCQAFTQSDSPHYDSALIIKITTGFDLCVLTFGFVEAEGEMLGWARTAGSYVERSETIKVLAEAEGEVSIGSVPYVLGGQGRRGIRVNEVNP